MKGAIQKTISVALRGGVAAFAFALYIHGSTKRPAKSAAQSAASAEITDEDIAWGWRLVSTTTNASISYAMPPEGRPCGKWHLRGAYEDVTIADFGDWRFPIGTNATSKMWAFVWGRMRPALRDRLHEIRAVDAPMSAIPSVSRLWTAATAEGGRLVTWERFALGRLRIGEPLTDERTVNAQIELLPNGGFVTRSNAVERTYARIDPDDWDGDGWRNADDSDPRAWTGGEFGLSQSLPSGANASAYCWIDLVADYNTRVVFAGDGPSDLEDPAFTARTGETNRVTLLIGKTYAVTASRPLRVAGRSSWQIRVEGDGTASLTIRYPVTVRAAPARGGGFAMSVVPSDLGGSFAWTRTCCPLTGLGNDFWYACSGLCACGGCAAEGTYAYEGYSLPCTGGACACPVGTDGPWTEPDDGPREASASVAFSAPAVIFEDAYTNRPGETVARRSTRTTLSCTAHGGERGAEVSFSLDGAERLARVSGAAMPVRRFVPPGQKLAFETTYEGILPSDAEGDIIARAVCKTDDDGDTPAATNSSALTSVKVELAAVYEAPENPCTNRHVYGVGEKVRFTALPRLSSVVFSTKKLDTKDNRGEYELFEDMETATADSPRVYTCPISENYHPPIRVRFADVEYAPSVTLVEPQEVITTGASWGANVSDLFYEGNIYCWPRGDVGSACLITTNYIGPMYVSFQGIAVSEVPCKEEDLVTGCFTNNHRRTHTVEAGAGMAHYIKPGNFWFVDSARSERSEANWLPDSTLNWKIPVGWHRKARGNDGWHIVLDVDYEVREDAESRPLLIGGRLDLYMQNRHIDGDGVYRTEKFGHWISRDRWCKIILDGKIQQRFHPLW